MTYSNLPASVADFLGAAQARDVDALLAVFTDDDFLNYRGEEQRATMSKGGSTITCCAPVSAPSTLRGAMEKPS
jgi:hypothetical protein